MSAARKRASSGSGLLETAAIVFFALVLGAFAASTWMRHAGHEGAPASVAESDPDTPPPVERARIRVEVRNGSGIPGAASDVTAYLRDAGFDVVDFGNAEEFDVARTVVIDRVGAPERAREVAAVLRGVPIRSGPDSTLYLDVTVLVGRDAPGLLGDGGAEEEIPRWRRWLDRARGLWR